MQRRPFLKSVCAFFAGLLNVDVAWSRKTTKLTVGDGHIHRIANCKWDEVEVSRNGVLTIGDNVTIGTLKNYARLMVDASENSKTQIDNLDVMDDGGMLITGLSTTTE